MADSHGPPLHLVATHPVAGAGLECSVDSPEDCGAPDDTRIELRFDRYLDPATVSPDSVRVHYSGLPDATVTLAARYDLVERVVVLSIPFERTWLRGVRYEVEVRVAEEDDDPGFRAFDGAPLVEEGSVPLEFGFRVRTGDAEPAPEAAPAPSCAEIQQLLAGAGCAAAICHQPVADETCPGEAARADAGEPCVGVPRMGLDLSSVDGLVATAINEVAHQTETGPAVGVPLQDPERVGVQMPIIDPGRPGHSYLLYKLLRNGAVWSRVPCETRHAVDLAGQCPAPPAAERNRLREWFVRGQPMPPDGSGSLDRQALDDLQSWIARGAPLEGCE